jgi:ketosteroid isomerase-like protein
MRFVGYCAFILAVVSATPVTGGQIDNLRAEVFATERAFAQSMVDRDHAAFVAHLSEEAVFFSGETALRGKQAVADAWQRFYEAPQAPFSWTPATVEVLDSGTLALSSGPVLDPQGQCIGTFTSIWRREAPGVWRIVFDKGSSDCPPPPATP